MIKDHRMEWSKRLPKKGRIMVCMLKRDSLASSGIFEEIAINNTTWENNKIVMVVDASLIISIGGLVTGGMIWIN